MIKSLLRVKFKLVPL